MTNEKKVVLRVENQTKRFTDLIANDCISFDVCKGEIHCLLGENGAGKSTLAKCLFGAYRPDSGMIYVNESPARFSSPRDAITVGIGMVHQHFVLIPPLTVIENIVVGTEKKGVMLDLKDARKRITGLCTDYQIELNLDAQVSTLSVGQQQWVEILKALYMGAEILILDEPTAVLTPQESERLFNTLKKMVSKGLAIILITHKLNEVMSISHRVTVLRKGKVIATHFTSEMSKESLAQLMVGREIDFFLEKPALEVGKPICKIENLVVKNDFKLDTVKNVSLTIHENEIVGIAGVAGNGQQEFFDALVGARLPCAGKITLDAREISGKMPKERIQAGVASIPPDRIEQGLLMGFSVEENLVFGFEDDSRFSNRGFLKNTQIRKFAADSIRNFDISTQGPDYKAGLLSGGNLQKIILAREVSRNIHFLIASSPTRGLDIGATEFFYKRLIQMRNQGAGILLISEDLDEIFNLSDRIAVIYKGEIMGVFPTKDVTTHQIGLLMAGIRQGE